MSCHVLGEFSARFSARCSASLAPKSEKIMKEQKSHSGKASGLHFWRRNRPKLEQESEKRGKFLKSEFKVHRGEFRRRPDLQSE